MKTRIVSFFLTILMVISFNSLQAQDWQLGYNYSKFAPVGFSLGYMPGKVGGYISGKFGLGGVNSETQYYSIDESAGVGSYEELGKKRNSYSAGLLIALASKVALYGGIGYGTYGEAWGKKDAEKAAIVINQFAGPEAELGLMYRGKSYYVGVGGIFMNGTNVTKKAMLCDVSLQFGFVF